MGKQPWEPRPVPEGIPGMEPHDCSYRRRVEQLERENHLLRLEIKVLKNPDLKQVAPTLVELAKEVEEQAKNGHINPRGFVEVQAWKVARQVGLDRNTVSRHIKTAADKGLVKKQTERTRLDKPAVSRATGEMRDYDSHLTVKADPGLVDRLIELANYKAPENHRSKWGGARVRCPDHPNAPVVKNTNYQCTECHRIIRTEREVLDDEERGCQNGHQKPA